MLCIVLNKIFCLRVVPRCKSAPIQSIKCVCNLCRIIFAALWYVTLSLSAWLLFCILYCITTHCIEFYCGVVLLCVLNCIVSHSIHDAAVWLYCSIVLYCIVATKHYLGRSTKERSRSSDVAHSPSLLYGFANLCNCIFNGCDGDRSLAEGGSIALKRELIFTYHTTPYTITGHTNTNMQEQHHDISTVIFIITSYHITSQSNMNQQQQWCNRTWYSCIIIHMC